MPGNNSTWSYGDGVENNTWVGLHDGNEEQSVSVRKSRFLRLALQGLKLLPQHRNLLVTFVTKKIS